MAVELKLAELSFDDSVLTDLRLTTGVDTVYGGLQADSMAAVIRGDGSVEGQALQEQKVQLFQDGELIATQCLKSSKRTGSRQVELSCRSDIEFLQSRFMGGIYNSQDPMTLLDEILLGKTYTLDADIIRRKLTGYLPVCSREDALQQVAFALGAVLSMDKNGQFKFNALTNTATWIPASRILSGGALETLPAYTKVELASHSYTPSSHWVTLFEGRDYGTEPVTLTFGQPYAEYSFAEGTLIDWGPNFVTFMPGYTTTLRARPYVHATAYHTVEEPAADSGYSKVLSVRDMTLVSPENAQQVLEWLYQRGQLVQKLQVTVLAQGERAGQPVQLPTPWGTVFSGYISKMKSAFTGSSQIAELTVCGREET